MKVTSVKFIQYIVFSMAAGLISSIPAGIVCCMVCLFFLIALMPVSFIICWITGGCLGWMTSKNEASLPEHTYIWCVMSSIGLGLLITHTWLFHNDFSYSLFWSVLFSFVFSVCSLPAIIYLKKRIVPDIFLPPIPQRNTKKDKTISHNIRCSDFTDNKK